MVEKTTLALLPLPPEEPDAPGEVPGPRGRVEKNSGLKKKQPSGFFVFFYFWVFWIFWVFCGFYIYICPEGVSRFFSVSRILLGASRL